MELVWWKQAGFVPLCQMYARCVLRHVGTRSFAGMKHAMIEIYCPGMAVVLVVKWNWVGIAHLDAPAQQYAEMVALLGRKRVTMVISLLSTGAMPNASWNLGGIAVLRI